ncbi:MAG TPA: hypothetical protein ENF73_02620 [Proteobacteria bacterium]|nr:hypothetical protein [Pseudomonadota bacterium]
MKCETELLGQEKWGSVSVCRRCGAVSINWGNASVRMPKELLESFVRMINGAYIKLLEEQGHRYEG